MGLTLTPHKRRLERHDVSVASTKSIDTIKESSRSINCTAMVHGVLAVLRVNLRLCSKLRAVTRRGTTQYMTGINSHGCTPVLLAAALGFGCCHSLRCLGAPPATSRQQQSLRPSMAVNAQHFKILQQLPCYQGPLCLFSCTWSVQGQPCC